MAGSAYRSFLRAALTAVACFAPLAHNAFAQGQAPHGWAEDAGVDKIRTCDERAISGIGYLGRGDRQVWNQRVDDRPIVKASILSVGQLAVSAGHVIHGQRRR